MTQIETEQISDPEPEKVVRGQNKSPETLDPSPPGASAEMLQGSNKPQGIFCQEAGLPSLELV